MLLAIDVGNTNTVFGIHDGEEWVSQWRAATDAAKTADEYAVMVRAWCKVEGIELSSVRHCLISSVVPQSRFNFRNLAKRYFGVEPRFVGDPDVKLGVPIRIRRPEQVGADRLVAAVGAHKAHGGPLIVIDSGTATTFDIVGADGGFEGGIIAPGINLSMRALHDAAAQLPRIEIRDPGAVIGQDTVSAMQAGVFWGYIELIDGLVRRIKSEYGSPMTTVATGGVVSLFENASKAIDVFDPDLFMRGLLEIHKRNPSTT